jgi:uncharacterized membrane protein
MHRHRKQWIRKALRRENRIADTNIIANLERNVSFLLRLHCSSSQV